MVKLFSISGKMKGLQVLALIALFLIIHIRGMATVLANNASYINENGDSLSAENVSVFSEDKGTWTTAA